MELKKEDKGNKKEGREIERNPDNFKSPFFFPLKQKANTFI